MKKLASLCVALVVLFCACAALAGETHPRKVLFICTGNFYRSRFAEGLFNDKTAKSWTAFSRGLDVSTPRKMPVSPLVVEELGRRHISTTRVPGEPTQISQADLDEASLIVLMNGDEHLPMLKARFPALKLDKVRSWSVLDVPKMSAPDAFAAISSQIERLRAELDKR